MSQTANIGRRLMAMVYDTFLVFALLLCAGGIVFAIRGGVAPPSNTSWYSLYLAGVAVAFFIGFWTHGGQTLGMRAWRLRLENNDGSHVTWRTALKRLGLACVSLAVLGCGFLIVVVDPEKRTWHGRRSGTRIRLQPKRQASDQ